MVEKKEKGGREMKRRDLLKAGVAGAATIGLIGLTKKGFAQAPQFKFRLQSFLGPGWKEWEEMLPRFCKKVNKMSGGRIEITPYPPGALVPTFELLDGVGKRVVEMGYGAQVYWMGTFPFCQWTWGIPFAFDIVDQYDYLWWEAGLNDLVREAFATKNVFFLGPIYSDEWGGTMCRKPIRSLKDFKGLKVRSFGIVAEIWKMNGAGIVRLPGEELYTGISTGVIDGVNWGSPYGMVATKLHEVAKYYCGPSLINYDMEDMFINMDAWKSLPSDLQELLVAATRVFALERASYSTYLSCLAIDQMKKAGVTILELPKEEVEQMRKMTWELLPKMVKKDAYTDRAMKIIFDTMKVFDQRPRFHRG
ncbi:MAG: TRAP transporter substrate-binding protein DctP [Thermodesulfobacteriota bacterium]|nr:TRAP transporter substrate-binding protein DctP [Thermodesulfobacteriota bacterium]